MSRPPTAQTLVLIDGVLYLVDSLGDTQLGRLLSIQPILLRKRVAPEAGLSAR